ncbi:MAG: hypothetical protein ABSD38_29360 [Syntrophorhabdales bacterium]|jgi:hypothetical protein
MMGASKLQGPGTLSLFSYPAASGISHEIDAAGILDVAVVLEAKDQAHSISKTDIDAFQGRTFDYFEGAVQRGFTEDLFRMLLTTRVIDLKVRRYAARHGIILVSPDRVPLPSLLAAMGRWDATEWFPDSYLGELTVLGERACRPLTAQRAGATSILYHYPLHLWTAGDLDDLEYLHEMASSHWLDWLDRTDPLHFEHLADRCLTSLTAWKELKDQGARG